jgi:hypothetical protein
MNCRTTIDVSEEISASVFSVKIFQEETLKHQCPQKSDQKLTSLHGDIFQEI